MNCRAAHTRIVAYQDGELAPGEATRVREHLDGCPACRSLDRRLAAVTPRPFLVVPSADAPMWEDLDDAIEEAWQARRDLPPETPVRALMRWLSDELRVPTGAMLAYAALLALVVGWGVNNWWTAQQLQVAIANSSAPVQVVVPAEIPADQFRPASWAPEEE